MISQTAEYALRAVVALTRSSGSPISGGVLSKQARIPADYLPRIMQQLSEVGIVRSKRGPGGGYSLAGSGNELTVLDVVNAIDPVRRIEHCPLKIPNHEALCPLHAKLDEAYAELQRVLASTRIVDLLPENFPTLQCQFPSGINEYDSNTP